MSLDSPPVPAAPPGGGAGASSSSHPTEWGNLFAPGSKRHEDLAVLERQLTLWCSARRAEAALYCSSEGRYNLMARHGSSRFPEAPETIEGTLVRIDLPGAVLLHSPLEAAVSSEDPDLLLLAAAARICQLKSQVHEQHFQANFRGVELEALYDVGLAIASTLDLEELCEEALLRAVSLLDARRGALYLLDDGCYRLTSRFGGTARSTFPADEIDLPSLLEGDSSGPEGWIPGAEFLLAVAVEIEGQPRGVLVVADKESRRGVGPFPSTDRRTLSLFANQAAIALENAKLHRLALEKQRLEREMELAAEIQQQLLPKAMPEIEGFQVLGWNRPAQQVGGDYFGMQRLEDGRWGLVVGDVTGKGVPASLLVSNLHSALRVLLEGVEVGPSLMDRLNRHIFESSSANKFITLILATLDPATGSLEYLNGGHNPGLLVRQDGSVEELSSAGLPIGLLAGATYGSETFQVDPGDLVCFYSDGITECESPDEEEFGPERLTELLVEKRNEPLSDLVTTIDRAVTGFAAGLPQGDDQTLLVLRRES